MKALERKYSKSERIVARAKFSPTVFLRQVVLAIILGGIIAVVWIFNSKIEGFFTKSDSVQYLTDYVMKWCVIGAGVFVLFCFILQAISLFSKELIVTENKLIYRQGILSVKSAVINITTIKSVEYDASVVSRLLNCGRIIVIIDAQKPYIIDGIIGADKLASRIMKQVSMKTTEIDKTLVQLHLEGIVPKNK